MRMTSADRVRTAVAALLHATGESQTDLAAALGVSQAQVSRRQSGSTAWSLDDCDAVAGHFGIDALDLLAGPTRASEALPDARRRGADRRTGAGAGAGAGTGAGAGAGTGAAGQSAVPALAAAAAPASEGAAR
ncbi:helix-turn-helix domain-containing protein [Streptomyces andamanensis]|uniref:Helix-turn-helix domain-containing protein n=1 Tax=Streptomyces andamanensis TaxID=1565035 RepID=A0ABV8TJH8_9ACTN